ncbi:MULTISPECIES: LCP family protein [unclassified Streptomyces]|uniref:LCP family protein n=1 Tax=unclassified Streptomyces TaxID=2593676 RepID=UPI0008DE8DF2|nr:MULTISPECIES: LCP family protein [unclassified Streptomyces]OII68555.1 LytR family transcriptional regulator [Streptomyces sp. CC77]
MDAHSRGRAEDIDPADQWVLNPQTGNYELRLDPSSAQSAPSVQGPPSGAAPRHDSAQDPAGPSGGRARGAAHPPAQRSASDAPDASGRPGESGRRAAEVPGQRRRRASEPAAGEGGRRGAAQGATGRRRPKPKKSRGKKALMWTGGVTAFVLVGTAAGYYYVKGRLDDNITTYDVGNAGGSSGFKKDQAINILVIGTDKRTGAGNTGYGDRNSPGHADTTILLHVSKDRTNATALSIPRDLKTRIPDCEVNADEGKRVVPGQVSARFNESLGQAERGPDCTMATVRELTGVPIDHFMMVDFNAVKTLSTAVGGVEVCVEKDVYDKKSGLKLPAGKSVIEGEQALAFVRTRQAFGLKSDLSRIQTQQQFMSAMIRKMKSGDTLTDPGKLWDLANAATQALTVDTGIGSVDRLTELAQELAKVDPKNISFVTLPVVDNPNETVKATVVLDEARAPQLFSMLQNDISLTEVKKKEQDAKNAEAKAQNALLEGPRAEAGQVRVDVYNGSGVRGGAQSTINWLQNEQGVRLSTNKANAPADIPKTTLEFAPNQIEQARKLADMMGLPASALKQGTADAGEREPMVLTLGKDFTAAGVPITGPAKAPEGVQKVEADKQVCAK